MARRISTRRLLTRLLVPLVGLVGIVILAPAPAQAAANDCPGGVACVWDQYNYNGNRINIAFSVYGYGCHNFPIGAIGNDDLEAVRNDLGGGKRFRIRINANCTGDEQTIASGHQVSYGLLNGFSNEVSSFQILPPL